MCSDDNCSTDPTSTNPVPNFVFCNKIKKEKSGDDPAVVPDDMKITQTDSTGTLKIAMLFKGANFNCLAQPAPADTVSLIM